MKLQIEDLKNEERKTKCACVVLIVLLLVVGFALKHQICVMAFVMEIFIIWIVPMFINAMIWRCDQSVIWFDDLCC